MGGREQMMQWVTPRTTLQFSLPASLLSLYYVNLLKSQQHGIDKNNYALKQKQNLET